MKLVSIVLILFAAFPAFAQKRVNNRQDSQRARIQQGVQSGELNRREAAKLRAGQRNVERLENKAEADGEITNKEKLRIEKAQDRQNRKIFREKHDGQEKRAGDDSAAPAPSEAGEASSPTE